MRDAGRGVGEMEPPITLANDNWRDSRIDCTNNPNVKEPMQLTDTQLQAIKDAAGKATQGERLYTSIGTIETLNENQICEDVFPEDADFFVLANPSTVSALVDEVMELRKRNELLENSVKFAICATSDALTHGSDCSDYESTLRSINDQSCHTLKEQL